MTNSVYCYTHQGLPSEALTRTTQRRSGAKPGRRLLTFGGHAGLVWVLSFSPDGRTLASGGGDHERPDKTGPGLSWNYPGGTLLTRLNEPATVSWNLGFSPDGRTLASGGGDHERPEKPGQALIWNYPGGALLATLNEPATVSWSLGFSPDGKELATGDDGGMVRLWDVEALRAGAPKERAGAPKDRGSGR